MRVFALHVQADREVEVAATWYERRRAGLGVEFLAELNSAFDLIAEAPRRFPPWPGVESSLGVRRLVLPRFPFSVAYIVDARRIVVLAVASHHRRPDYWLRRRSRLH